MREPKAGRYRAASPLGQFFCPWNRDLGSVWQPKVYCPSCYSTRRPVDLEHWAVRCVATARFRCSGTRYDGAQCPGHWHASDQASRAAAGRRPGTASLLVVQPMHLGNRPGAVRQAPWLGSASTIAALAALVALTGTYMDQHGGRAGLLLLLL
jgi:hypothetical protein